MIVKFIPLLSTFSTQNIQFGTLEERRRNARSNINILFPSELENTTLILDATPLPIERRRDEPLNGDEGVWDEAHKMFGTIPLCQFKFYCCLSSFVLILLIANFSFVLIFLIFLCHKLVLFL
jgi:hypothetical protein